MLVPGSASFRIVPCSFAPCNSVESSYSCTLEQGFDRGRAIRLTPKARPQKGRMKILFLDGTPGFYPDRLKEKPTGGILTSLTHIPRILVEKGHDVSVASLHEKTETVEGVKYIGEPIADNIWDVVVFNRNFLDREMVAFFKDSYKVWWLHDVVDHRYMKDDAYRKINHVIALSQYQADAYTDFYGLPESIPVSIIPNGVDKSIFYPGTEKRDRNLYVIGSAPIKGMFPVEFAFENMRRLNPDFELRAYVGDSLHGIPMTDDENSRIDALKKLGVNFLQPIPQKDLADVFRSAWALLMPSHYPEMCSNIMLQALACGLPVITSPIGSAPEYIEDGHNGRITQTTSSDWYWWWKQYANACAETYIDEESHKYMSENAPKGIYSWENVGQKWNAMLLEHARMEAV